MWWNVRFRGSGFSLLSYVRGGPYPKQDVMPAQAWVLLFGQILSLLISITYKTSLMVSQNVRVPLERMCLLDLSNALVIQKAVQDPSFFKLAFVWCCPCVLLNFTVVHGVIERFMFYHRFNPFTVFYVSICVLCFCLTCLLTCFSLQILSSPSTLLLWKEITTSWTKILWNLFAGKQKACPWVSATDYFDSMNLKHIWF